MLGLVVGCLVAALFVGAAGVYDAAVPGSNLLSLNTPILVSGAVGGWLMAPQASSPHDRVGWAGVVLALGLAGVALGDVAIVTIFMISQPFGAPAWTATTTVVAGALAEVAAASWLAIVGAVLYGWLALLVTVPAAAVWAAAMRFAMARTGIRR